MTLLEVRGLRSGYGKLPVLHGIDLRVGADETVGIVGPNGSGKSTLLKTIFQLLKPMDGSIVFDGIDLTELPTSALAELGLGYVPQGGNTFATLTVEENLRVSAASTRGMDVAAGLKLAYEQFPILRDRRLQSASTLSGGERQMLALAGATIKKPRLLVLDEPTTGLAPTIVQDVIQQVAEFRRAGGSVLWVIEENPEIAVSYCDRVCLIQGGLVHRVATAKEVLEDGVLEELFLGNKISS